MTNATAPPSKRQRIPQHAQRRRLNDAAHAVARFTDALIDSLLALIAVIVVIVGIVLLILGDFPENNSPPPRGPTEIDAIP